jgi:hypothetical protein
VAACGASDSTTKAAHKMPGGCFLIPNPLPEFDRTVKREDYQADPQGCARRGRLDAVVNNSQVLISDPARHHSYKHRQHPISERT